MEALCINYSLLSCQAPRPAHATHGSNPAGRPGDSLPCAYGVLFILDASEIRVVGRSRGRRPTSARRCGPPGRAVSRLALRLRAPSSWPAGRQGPRSAEPDGSPRLARGCASVSVPPAPRGLRYSAIPTSPRSSEPRPHLRRLRSPAARSVSVSVSVVSASQSTPSVCRPTE